eukprot:TRINITY_DN37204_c0_g1_i1.p1 TRINITY_DN37204_c0_g1~~TRINITY_DN37204_c0_g1_i1.p1  ORF type:complete len:118 (-),score=21.86 TRINITY_DN37204_c0_g1_i1:87-440(-)
MTTPSRSQSQSTYSQLQVEGDLGIGPLKSIEGYIICITGIHEEAQDEDIFDAFGGFGAIKNLHLNLDRRTGFAKGYALLEYETMKEAKEAIESMKGSEFLGKVINVDWAFKRPKRSY